MAEEPASSGEPAVEAAHETEPSEPSGEPAVDAAEETEPLPWEAKVFYGPEDPPPALQFVKVFYGTDRERTGSSAPNDFYGWKRGGFELGTCTVSIPPHKTGELERPFKIELFNYKLLELSEDPRRHVVLLTLDPLSRNGFFTELAGEVAGSADRSALVYVHGYNTEFAEAARQTALIAHDLQFEGPAMFFSWPSQGSELGYDHDKENIEFSAPHLESFLDDVRLRTGIEKFHIIAHSLGSRYLTAALSSIRAKTPAESLPIYNQVILSAPDIDAQIFRDTLVPAIRGVAERITLYASSRDVALKGSGWLHGDYRRAGDSDAGILVVEGIDSIDASEVETSFLGHTPHSERSVLADIFLLVRHGLAPDQRNLLRQIREGIRYWRFRP